MRNDNFVCTVRKVKIYRFINTISAQPCLLLSAACHSDWNVVCIADRSSSTQNSIDVYAFLAINNIHLPMNTKRWNASAVKNSIHARRLFGAGIVSSHSAIITDVIQRLLVVKLWIFTQNCGEVQVNEWSLDDIVICVYSLGKFEVLTFSNLSCTT